MKRSFVFIVSCVVVFVFSMRAQAITITTFDDKSVFLAETGATSTIGPLPNLGNVGVSQTVSDLTFSTTSPSADIFFLDFTGLLVGNEIGIAGIENLNIDINTGLVSSFGFDFVEPSSVISVDSTFTVSLLNSAVFVGSFNFNVPYDTAAFVGVLVDELFDRVEIREIAGDAAVNEYWGEFYTGTTSSLPVPEPTTIALLGIGLAGLAGVEVRRRRKQKTENS